MPGMGDSFRCPDSFISFHCSSLLVDARYLNVNNGSEACGLRVTKLKEDPPYTESVGVRRTLSGIIY